MRLIYDEWIVRDDAHAQRRRSLGDRTTDAAQPHNAEYLAAQLCTDKSFAFPVGGFNAAISLRYISRECDQQSNRVFRGGYRVAVGRVHHDDSTCSCRRHINIVNAHAGAADYSKSRCAIEDFACDFCFASHNQPIPARQLTYELLI